MRLPWFSSAPGRDRAVALLLVLVVAALAYAPTLDNGFLNLDDDTYVSQNPTVRGGLTLRSAWWALTIGTSRAKDVDYWQPATLLSRLLDATLFGMNPAGHHLTSLLLHAANAALVLLLLAAATGRLWRSAFVALVFAAHPLHVSSVSWVTERKDVLSLFFSLVSLLLFARFAAAYRDWLDAPPGTRGAGEVVRRYLLLVAGYALALMSKPTTLPLPLAMLVVAYWPIRRERRPGLARLALSLAPLLLPAAAASLVYSRAGIAGPALGWFATFPLQVGKAVVTSVAAYPGRLLLPVDLQHLYTAHPEALTAGRAAWSLALLGALSTVAIAGRRRRPHLLAGWLWYLLWLIPVVPLFAENLAADRFAYLPVIGLTVMAAWGLGEAAGGRAPALRRAAAAAVVTALALITRAECRHWKDSRTLFTHLVSLDPRHFVGHRNLGGALSEAGDHAGALASYRAALAGWKPGRYPYDLATIAGVYNNMGVELNLLGRPDEALRHFTAATALDPRYARAFANAGIVHLGRGELDAAAGPLRRALDLEPENLLLVIELGRAYFGSGRYDRAAEQFQRVLDLVPNDPANLNNLGSALLLMGDLDRAQAHFERALRLKPGDPTVRENLRLLDERRRGGGP